MQITKYNAFSPINVTKNYTRAMCVQRLDSKACAELIWETKGYLDNYARDVYEALDTLGGTGAYVMCVSMDTAVVGGKLYCVATIQTSEVLCERDIKRLEESLECLYSEGIFEGMQFPFLETQEYYENELGEQDEEKQTVYYRMELWENSPVFVIEINRVIDKPVLRVGSEHISSLMLIGLAREVLIKHGMRGDAIVMCNLCLRNPEAVNIRKTISSYVTIL